MTQYDPNIIRKFASRLYSRANSIIFLYTLGGLILGWVGGQLAMNTFHQYSDIPLQWIGAGIAAIIGFAVGTERAFSLKLQAQTALCQVQIEENTRRQPQQTWAPQPAPVAAQVAPAAIPPSGAQ